jgi:hypothetical protein
MDLSPVTTAASAVAGGVGQVTASWDTSHLVALAAALGWASGLRLYAVVFLTGLAGRLAWLPLPEGLLVLQQPLVLGAAGVMLVVEFLADKVPWVDSAWDAVHTLIRIPSGAALAAAAMGADGQSWSLIAALLGGTLAATAHVAKATTRAAVNTSPEPISNIALSLLGDAAVPAMLWLAWSHPGWFLIVLTLVVVAMLVVTVLMMRFARHAVGRVRQMLSPSAARA